jgi:hypothetical protein
VFIFAFIHGALATGLVSNLAYPTSNVTGIESLAPEIDAKRVPSAKTRPLNEAPRETPLDVRPRSLVKL